MSRLSNIQSEDLRAMLGTVVQIPAGIVTLDKAGGTASKVDATNPYVPVIGGVPKAAITLNEAVLTAVAALQQAETGLDTFYVQPASTTVYYTLLSDGGVTDGTTVILALQGTYAGQAFTAFKTKKGDGSIPEPAQPLAYAVVGYIKVVTDSTHTFTPATTAFDAAGITSTFYDAIYLP